MSKTMADFYRSVGVSLVVLAGFLAFVVPPASSAEPATPRKSEVSKAGSSRVAAGAPSTGPSAASVPRSGPPRSVPLPGLQGEESDKIKRFVAWSWNRLTFPGTTIPTQPLTKARQHARESVPEGASWQLDDEENALAPAGRFSSLAIVNPGIARWESLGPTPLDATGTSTGYRYGRVSGRVNAVAVDPTDPNVAYAGATAGGVWKTTNLGAVTPTWSPLWDGKDFVTQAVGAIAIDPNDHLTVYVGTGDFDAADQFSEGIMKTTDGGATWTQLGADVFTPYGTLTPTRPNQNVGQIAIDPRDSRKIMVGARFGFFMSHDAGETWLACAVKAGGAGIERTSAVLLDASTSPTTAYVGVGYVATNFNGNNGVYTAPMPASGCPTFTLRSSGWPAGTGNGTNGATNVGRIRLASSRGNATRNLVIYAQVQDATNYNALGTWVTTNQGATWTQLTGSADTNYKDCAGTATGEGQDWYDLFIAVDPWNDKNLVIGRVDTYKAVVNAGYTSMTITDITDVYTTSCAGYGKVHPDQHAAAWLDSSGEKILIGNDGGVYLNDRIKASTYAEVVSGWKQVNEGISTIQFYAGQPGANFASATTQYLFGGAQDNGNSGWDSGLPDRAWVARSIGGDGFFAAFDPILGTNTAGRWYTEYTNGVLFHSTAGAAGNFSQSAISYTGESPDWSTPFIVDTLHCNTTTGCSNVVLGADSVRVSVATGAPAFTKVSGLLESSAANYSIIAVNVSPAEPKTVVAGTDEGRVYWTNNAMTGANCTQALSNTTTFACTANAAATWVNLTASPLPVRVIQGVATAPNNSQQVYAAVGGFNVNTPGVNGHLFRATCASACTTATSWTWVDKTGNLPDVPAWSVAVHPKQPQIVFVGTEAGFFYTRDIEAASPTWLRYQDGLPNSVIRYLTIDRGPAADPILGGTTLVAFTYGRGAFGIRLPATAAGFCDRPGVPANVSATGGTAQVTVSWSAGSPAGTTYDVYRSDGSCPGGSFSKVGSTGSTSFTDTGVAATRSYSYQVVAVGATSDCTSAPSGCASATPAAACAAPPTFAGLTSATTSSCGVTLSWGAASSSCGGTPTYDIYRSTVSGFTPGAGSRIATGVTGTTYADSGLGNGTYYYVARAFDPASGLTDANAVQRTATVSAAILQNGTWTAGAENGDPVLVADAPWGRTTSRVRTGAGAYHSGYGDSDCASLTTPPITLTAGQTSTLTFWTAYALQAGIDAVRVEISTDGGSTWAAGPAGLHPNLIGNTTTNACGWARNTPCFSATNQLTFTSRSASLAAYAGSTVRLRWRFSTNPTTGSTTYQGFFLDDISITNAQVPACSAAPSNVPFLTARSTATQNMLEWVAPQANASSVRICWSTATPPTSPYSCGTSYTDQAVAPGTYGTWTHTGLTNDTTYFYTAFVGNGLGSYSSGRSTRGRPQNTASATVPIRWVYQTGATALAPPGIASAVMDVSNDRAAHSVGTGSTGGSWPSGWTPLGMNGPSQDRPLIVPYTIGAATTVAFVSSQDGYVYAVDAAAGRLLWTSPRLGDILQASPSGVFTKWGGVADLLFVGTRSATQRNVVYALKATDGSVAWSFDNGTDGPLGIVAGSASAQASTSRLWFATRSTTGNTNTLYCLSFTPSAATKVWAKAVGDIDGSPILAGGRLYVGTNGGDVVALDPASGSTWWTRTLADGPVKRYPFPDLTASPLVLFAATNGRVTAVRDDGGTSSTLWSTALPSPSTPVVRFAATSRVYAGAGDGKLWEFDKATGATKSVVLGAGTSLVGPVAYDAGTYVYVGTDSGALYAVEVPFP